MKFRIASDFHLEFYTYRETGDYQIGRDIHEKVCLPIMEGESDQILLLAGDILTASTCHKYVPFFDRLSSRFKEILVIAGNHEHYNSEYFECLMTLKTFYSQGWSNIKFLNNEVVKYGDIGLFCGTLWTDFGGDRLNVQSMMAAQFGMPDYRLVMYGNSRFTPHSSVLEHIHARSKLKEFLESATHQTKVVMTHHAPSFQSISPKFVGSQLNPAFASDLDELILTHNPALWVHGHMHNNSDYNIGNTRIICNPYGYHGENPGYNSNLVVDITSKE